MLLARLLAAAFLFVFLLPLVSEAQSAASRVLFRVFLSDGRVLASYGEWARVQDRVIFSIPTQLTRTPVELQLVSIPTGTVDWRRTEEYAESVRAAAYAASRGDADFAQFSSEVAKALNEVSQIADPAVRLARAETARRSLADWPASHYGYRINEVREWLGVLDEVIAQLRVSVGQTRFDLSLSLPLAVPPPPPLPPPTDAELVEQLVAAASLAGSSAERASLLETVLRVLDRAAGVLPQGWADRVRRSVRGDLDQERRAELGYASLRQSTLEAAVKAASSGDRSELERLRDRVRAEDRRLGGRRTAELAALLATMDLHNATLQAREAQKLWEKQQPAYRRYRRATGGSFNVFKDAMPMLEQIRSMTGPALGAIDPLAKRIIASGRNLARLTPPSDLADEHALVRSAWELAENALRLRREAVAGNSVETAHRASSAAAGALMLYQRARADLTAAMEPPSVQ